MADEIVTLEGTIEESEPAEVDLQAFDDSRKCKNGIDGEDGED